MAWVATAIVGGSVASSFLGGRSADKATKASAQASAAELKFEKQKYEDWRETYGDLESNLAEYYTTLSPTYYSTVGIEQAEKEFAGAMDNIRASLAQRGIDPSSGLAMDIERRAELDLAEQKAEIRRDAPRMATEDQTRFLQIGLGQNPGSSLSAALAGRADRLAAEASAQQAAAGRAMGNAVNTAGTALSNYLANRTNTNAAFVATQPQFTPTTSEIAAPVYNQPAYAGEILA